MRLTCKESGMRNTDFPTSNIILPFVKAWPIIISLQLINPVAKNLKKGTSKHTHAAINHQMAIYDDEYQHYMVTDR